MPPTIDGPDPQEKERLIAECLQEIERGEKFQQLVSQPGWKKLEQMILERTNELSRRLLTLDNIQLYRAQGEALGIQSILNIVNSEIENIAIAKEDLARLQKENNDETQD